MIRDLDADEDQLKADSADVFRRQRIIDECGPAYYRGKQIADGIMANWQALHMSRKDCPVFIPMMNEPLTFIGDNDNNATTMAVRAFAIHCVEVVDAPIDEPVLALAQAVGGPRGRPCIADSDGRWLAWMRREMPPGEVHPDIAVYYDAQGIDCGPWERGVSRTAERLKALEQRAKDIWARRSLAGPRRSSC